MGKTITLTVPETSAELEEALHDEATVRALMLDPKGMKEWADGYMKAATSPDMVKDSGEQMKRVMTELLEDNGFDGKLSKRPAMDEAVARQMAVNGGQNLPWFKSVPPDNFAHFQSKAQAMYEPETQGAALDGVFGRMGNYLQNAAALTDSYWLSQNLKGVSEARLKVLGESQGDAGGFLVPEEFRVQLLSLALEAAIVRPRAFVIPMTTLKVRIPAIRDTSHATTVFGGMQFFWTPESGAFTSSEPTFSSVALEAKKLTGLTRVGNELIKDSAIAIESLLTRLMGQGINFFEDDAFINGVGSGQPLGILNADALVSVAKETGQAATTIVWENLIKMYARMLPSSLGNAVWICNNDVFPQLATLALNVGTGGSAIWINNGVGSPPTSILGRPVLFTEKAQTLGTAGDIYFTDLSYYLIGDRQNMEIASSLHTRFTTDETEFRIIERVDGRPWIETALTPRNSTNTLTPFVALATRS